MSQQSTASDSKFAATLNSNEKAELIRDIYKKHSAELLTIEEAQQKLILLLLGVFGAGASFLASGKTPLPSAIACFGLTLVTLGMIIVGWRYTKRRDQARHSVRKLLIECEKALGLFDTDLYRPDLPLYHSELKKYPQLGYWLSHTFWIAALSALGFLVVLWAPYIPQCHAS